MPLDTDLDHPVPFYHADYVSPQHLAEERAEDLDKALDQLRRALLMLANWIQKYHLRSGTGIRGG